MWKTTRDLQDPNRWIPFTQFLRPNGEKHQTFCPTPKGYGKKVAIILATGHKFEVEVLRTGIVSQTISNGESDIAIELSSNDINVEEATKRLIDSAFNKIIGEA